MDVGTDGRTVDDVMAIILAYFLNYGVPRARALGSRGAPLSLGSVWIRILPTSDSSLSLVREELSSREDKIGIPKILMKFPDQTTFLFIIEMVKRWSPTPKTLTLCNMKQDRKVMKNKS